MTRNLSASTRHLEAYYLYSGRDRSVTHIQRTVTQPQTIHFVEQREYYRDCEVGHNFSCTGWRS
jgi:hypothetical protein